MEMTVFRVEYEKTLGFEDITADISPYVESVKYTDYLEGASDEIELTLSDGSDGFKGDWYPVKGDRISLWIGNEDVLLPCGVFELDEFEFSGGGHNPDTLMLKGLATGIKQKFRERHSEVHEEKSLKELAEETARYYSLQLVGEMKDIELNRLTRIQETPVGFLKRIADEYDHAFKIVGNKMVFFDRSALENREISVTIVREKMTSYSFRDQSAETYASASNDYEDPEAGETFTAEEEEEGVKGDRLVIRKPVKNKFEAQRKAKSALRKHNRRKLQCQFALTRGEPLLMAGINAELAGFLNLDGIYHVTKSTHTADRSGGYVTECEGYRV